MGGIVSILYQYCTNIVSILYQSCILHKTIYERSLSRSSYNNFVIKNANHITIYMYSILNKFDNNRILYHILYKLIINL